MNRESRPHGRRWPAAESERHARRTARRRRAAGELEVRRLCRTMPALSPLSRGAVEALILDITDRTGRRALLVVTA